MMKKGKEIKMGKSYENYNVVSGTVDSKNPKTVYIQITAWGDPMQEDVETYTSVIRCINKTVKSVLYKTLKLPFNKNRTIVDLDIRESGILFGKRSFMSCEVTLFQNDVFGTNKLLVPEELKKMMGSVTDTLIEDVFDKDEHFEFHRMKN